MPGYCRLCPPTCARRSYWFEHARDGCSTTREEPHGVHVTAPSGVIAVVLVRPHTLTIPARLPVYLPVYHRPSLPLHLPRATHVPPYTQFPTAYPRFMDVLVAPRLMHDIAHTITVNLQSTDGKQLDGVSFLATCHYLQPSSSHSLLVRCCHLPRIPAAPP